MIQNCRVSWSPGFRRNCRLKAELRAGAQIPVGLNHYPTTAAEGGTDRAGSPGNRRPRPGGLPAADATGGGAAGPPVGCWRPCRRPGPRQPRALCVRPRITPRSNRTNHHALPVPASARSEGRAQAPRFLRVVLAGTPICPMPTRSQKETGEKQAEKPEFAAAAPRDTQTPQTFANRQSQGWERKDEGRKITAETQRRRDAEINKSSASLPPSLRSDSKPATFRWGCEPINRGSRLWPSGRAQRPKPHQDPGLLDPPYIVRV